MNFLEAVFDSTVLIGMVILLVVAIMNWACFCLKTFGHGKRGLLMYMIPPMVILWIVLIISHLKS